MYDDFLLIFGGAAPLRFFGDVWAFQPRAQLWSQMTVHEWYAPGFSFNFLFFARVGLSAAEIGLSFVLSPSPPLTSPHFRPKVSLLPSGAMTDKGFLIGGGLAFENSEVNSPIYAYDLDGNFWRKLWTENRAASRLYGQSTLLLRDRYLISLGGGNGFIGEAYDSEPTC